MSAPAATGDAAPSSREGRFIEDLHGQHSYQPGPEPEGSDAFNHQNTLKKRDSVSRKASVQRSGSKKSGLDYIHNVEGQLENRNSVFYTPIPTQGNPTEALANRFLAWRKVLKNFITYFREVQASYEGHAKGINKTSQALVTAVQPPDFARSGGILETNAVLHDFQKESYTAMESAIKTLAEITNSLTALRRDLNDKIKEIKGLSGDFKNSVEKEKESTRKEIVKLNDALTAIDSNPQSAAGKSDPYLVKLGLEKQLKRQIDEENYLHKAYKNIENSGRQLEEIVVGEVQRVFGIYIGLLKREGAESSHLVQKLEASIMQLPNDYEWSSFIDRDPNMVDQSVPLRSPAECEYPGYKHPAALEVVSGLLERKSKYLKSYTPGWYVLSPTHLHEFKTSERTSDPNPVMSFYLPESTLGKHSEPGATSHKFFLKARQTGHLHLDRGWVFRAESHEAMLQWYGNIKKLIKVSGEERNAFVAGATRSQAEATASVKDELETSSENDLENDEADDVPYSAGASVFEGNSLEPPPPVRPEGGRFPSDINIHRSVADTQVSSPGGSARSLIAAAGAVAGGNYMDPEGAGHYGEQRPRSDSHSSTWSYDDKHPAHSTLEDDDDDFLPVGANIPPAVERRMSVKHDYSREHEPRERRYSSNSAMRGPPSRKPTASYGIDPVTGQPDTGMGSPSQLSNIDWAQILSHSENKPSGAFPKKTPSRRPTASYGIDPISGQAEHDHRYPILENQPIGAEVSSSVTDPDAKLTAERPTPDRTESKITISDLRIPGEYPKAV